MPPARHAGVLLHPTSLPGPGPIGELGPYAHAHLEWMAQSGLDTWQVLPLHPVGPGLSPYASPSAFAGDVRLISVETLVQLGLLDPVPMPWGHEAVDPELVDRWKIPLLRRAAEKVTRTEGCRAWVRAQGPWLADWALYAAFADAETVPGVDAERQFVRNARPKRVPAELKAAVAVHEGLQYLFATQWDDLRSHARRLGIRLLGDVPLFVSGDGCDVWTNPALFHRNAAGRLDPIAGVPPDYFSPEGQRWGNPTYDWASHQREGFAWWTARLRRELELVDTVRIDHFRGLVANWAIAADEPDARKGTWRPGPGKALFDALAAGLGGLPLLAEDLGDITPDVTALRETLGLPGMKILQFAFGGASDHAFLPHNFQGSGWAVYTGTHDNDTAVGWYEKTDDTVRHRFRRYVGRDGSNPAWALCREAWASVAELAVAPMQDLLGLDSQARMNTPGVARGNWGWRMREIPWGRAPVLRDLAVAYGRSGLADEA